MESSRDALGKLFKYKRGVLRGSMDVLWEMLFIGIFFEVLGTLFGNYKDVLWSSINVVLNIFLGILLKILRKLFADLRVFFGVLGMFWGF